MVKGWLDKGDKIVMAQVTYEVFFIFDKFILLSIRSPLKYHIFDDIISLNEFVYSTKNKK